MNCKSACNTIQQLRQIDQAFPIVQVSFLFYQTIAPHYSTSQLIIEKILEWAFYIRAPLDKVTSRVLFFAQLLLTIEDVLRTQLRGQACKKTNLISGPGNPRWLYFELSTCYMSQETNKQLRCCSVIYSKAKDAHEHQVNIFKVEFTFQKQVE